MNTLDIQFGYGQTLYNAKAELLPIRPTHVMVFDFVPALPTGEKEINFVHKPVEKTIGFPATGPEQMKIAGSIYAAVYDAYNDAGIPLF